MITREMVTMREAIPIRTEIITRSNVGILGVQVEGTITTKKIEHLSRTDLKKDKLIPMMTFRNIEDSEETSVTITLDLGTIKLMMSMVTLEEEIKKDLDIQKGAEEITSSNSSPSMC